MPLADPAEPFVGSAAVQAGRLTGHQLRSGHRRLFPDVYLAAGEPVTPDRLVRGAALWAPAGAVIGGLAAGLFHRERWYAPAAVGRGVDVYAVGTAPAPRGVRLRRLRRALPAGHVVTIGGLRVTSAARTAVDVARWEFDDDAAIAKIDAVCNRSRISVSEVSALAESVRGLHGLRRVRGLLHWCDPRADSPPETRLRLLLVRSDLPDPTPQVAIRNEYGARIATADLAYEAEMVAVFYDGEVHRGKDQWEYDARVNAELAELGWQVVRVTGSMLRNPRAVLRQARAALERGRHHIASQVGRAHCDGGAI
ncbi:MULTISPECIES: endonuclease domain-containing protein [unclassified Dietzia]|uniref:endonuclease domain-containing protein n=1 Tax=unclassified Dietzia TaxID=2617939 RepID=UPI0012E78089|nr:MULTISPECIES: hypothetical protein [unclassified Dietzia]MBB1025641.1 hypothetical protein [Dietzia sp. DQ12-76]